MKRRSYLAGLGIGLAGGLAGCSATGGGGSSSFSSYDGPTKEVGGVELPVPRSQLARGASKDRIPAITEPAFADDWSGLSASLTADDEVIGVVRDGAARAYPLAVLNWHEIVNDEFGGPLLVTYCPLCGSGVTAVRRVDGEVTNFGVSGFLWMSDLVMYDQATDSLWSQIFATAIRGAQTGATLELVPSTITAWGSWREEHPDTEVLLPPPESETINNDNSPRSYDSNPYAGYASSGQVGIGNNGDVDDRLHPKTQVIGVAADGEARAYPLETVSSAGVVNDTVGDLPVVVTTTADGSLVAYERRVDGETLTFRRADERHLRAGGSRWRLVSGTAVDGPHEGSRLVRANDRSQMFWFAWADFNPDTEIFGRE